MSSSTKKWQRDTVDKLAEARAKTMTREEYAAWRKGYIDGRRVAAQAVQRVMEDVEKEVNKKQKKKRFRFR